MWLEVVTTRRSLRLIVWSGLITAGLLSTVWLSPLLELVRTPDSLLLYLDLASLVFLRSPYFVLVLGALWGFPLAASLWHRRISSPTAAQWAFLDPSPLALMLRPHNRFRLSQALKVGLVGGLAFCALLLIARFWWNSVPETVRNTDEAKLAFFGSQVGAAAVVQAIVASIVTIRVRWLGVLHGLFAAFVAGCMMVVGILGLNLVFGRGIDAPFAWTTFSAVANGGAQLALLVSGCVSAVASLIRHDRSKYWALNRGSK